VERLQEGGISVARGSFDGSGSVDGAFEATRNCAVAVEGANGGVGVAHVADGQNISVSVKKMGAGRTGWASKIVKVKSSGQDPRATRDLNSDPSHPRVNKTDQPTWHWLIPSPLINVFISYS